MPVVVNGEVIPDAEIRAEVKRLRPEFEPSPECRDDIEAEEELRALAKQSLVRNILLRQEATRRQITVEQLLENLTGKLAPPKMKDIAAHYKRHRETLWNPVQLHVAHIVKNVDERRTEAEALEQITAIEQRLKNGEGFAALADEASDCPGNGGDIRWIEEGEMVPEFDKVVFALPVGEVSGIFRTPFGFHIAKVLERKPEGILSFEDAKPLIEFVLLKEKRERVIDELVYQLASKSEIRW